jgi:hypothetical protein
MDITLPLNANEQQVFLNLLDAAARQLGLSGAQAVAHFSQKLSGAQQEAVKVASNPQEIDSK